VPLNSSDGGSGARLRRIIALWPVALVIVSALAGAFAALALYRADYDTRAGTVRVAVDPGHAGALDIYVPLVDWGARFSNVRLPVRLRLEARTVNSRVVTRIASQRVDTKGLRRDARSAIASYIRRLVGIVLVAGFALGALVALALRGVGTLRLSRLLASALATALLAAGAVALLLPPHGTLQRPEYYANGSQIPVALRVAQRATGAAQVIRQDLDDQLVGLARLISIPRERSAARPLPRVTLASDLHNNVLGLPALERAAAGMPLFFVGDLTTSGIPLEVDLTRAVVDAGKPFLFVSGNHDSDTLSRALARQGALVLTQQGRLQANGRHGALVVRVGALRVVGYSDPFERRRANGYRATQQPDPTEDQKQAFWRWLQPLVGRVDVVMVHNPALADEALAQLQAAPPAAPLLFFTGHTHEQEVRRLGPVTLVNGGTIGGGGAGNFHENQPFGLAVVTYQRHPFEPLAADLVRINPRDGSATAERRLLNDPEPRARRP
jgi:predicted phosphodiesterase